MADNTPTTSSAKFGAAIDRLRQIAVQSGETLLLANGPPHPDAKLLDLCADIGHGRQLAEAAFKQWVYGDTAPWQCNTLVEALAMAERKQTRKTADKNYAAMLKAAAKIKATTAAGIYAKAIAVRSSKTGAALLAMSMADDLLACEQLRQSLWADAMPVSHV